MSLVDTIRAAAARYGLPPGFLVREAQIESGLDPNNANPTSSAKGLFQFIDSTRRQYGNFDPYDPAASSDAAAHLASDNARLLRGALGREPTGPELYLAHQQGGAGAVRLLQNPDAPAASIVGADAIRLNGGAPNMTARDFVNLWAKKFDGTASPSAPAIDMAQATPNVGTPVLPRGAVPSDIFALAMPQPAAQTPAPQPKKQGIDLGRLFSSLSPNLVLGRT